MSLHHWLANDGGEAPGVDQYVCEHGHAYYDGDQGVGSPTADGEHDATHHAYDPGVADWEPWERNAYRHGYTVGMANKADQP